MLEVIRKVRNNRAGTTAIEYCLIATLVSVAAVSALTAAGGSLSTIFTTASTEIANATSAATSP